VVRREKGKCLRYSNIYSNSKSLNIQTIEYNNVFNLDEHKTNERRGSISPLLTALMKLKPLIPRCCPLSSSYLLPTFLPSLPPADFTYFYKGKEYWKFDNQKLTVEPGYPKSILRDWMGCDPSDMGRSGSTGNRGDRRPPPDDVDIMATIDDAAAPVNAIAVVIPSVLSLCVLVLVYTVFQFKNKEEQQSAAPPHYHKYPVQEWV